LAGLFRTWDADLVPKLEWWVEKPRRDKEALAYEASTQENVTPETRKILQFEALLNDLWHRDNYLQRSFWTHGNRRFSRGRSLAALGSEVSMFRYRFWFHRKDGKGRPLDEKIVKAAEEIAPIVITSSYSPNTPGSKRSPKDQAADANVNRRPRRRNLCQRVRLIQMGWTRFWRMFTKAP